MEDIAIRVENVNKVFRIYDSPYDRVKEAFSFKKKKYYTDYYALKNINFHVKKGEFLGIIGKNGAGKSTLLRILSRELTPTAGRVTSHGKLALLQLGVGFDQELTGIENARFASKILGYSDNEINGMIEDIIAFADIGEFIFHPVKTYSSGMYSRLAFAVAINIDPDILMADEVLAVGDMQFSLKCLRKMKEFKEKGKTMILVTHSVETVNIFCDSALWIKDGEICEWGEAKRVSTAYAHYMFYGKMPNEYHSVEMENNVSDALPVDSVDQSEIQKNDAEKEASEDKQCESVKQSVEERESVFEEQAEEGSLDVLTRPDHKEDNIDYDSIEWIDLSNAPCIGDGRAEIKRMAFILNETLKKAQIIQGNENVILLMDVLVKKNIENPQVGIRINNRQGLVAVHTNNDICGRPLGPVSAGKELLIKFSFKLPSLSNGNYTISIGLQDNERMPQLLEDVFEFRVFREDSKSIQCGYVIVENENVDFHVS